MARNIAPQDITWFLDLNERGRLDLSPPYQRRSVWSPKDRKYFLDTVFNGYPCPPLFLYKSISDTGTATFHVVDGKQRLETIINYANSELSIPIDFIDANLAGKKFKQLTTEQKKVFWNYQFAVELLDVVNDATVKEIFGRYNRTSKNLDPQELRHAKYDGWFISFAEKEAEKVEWSRFGISTTSKARRMKDVQFISELMIEVLNDGLVVGFDQERIEDYHANYETPNEFDPDFSEDEFIHKFENVKSIISQMDDHNSSITIYAKSLTHFYTLWSVLASGELVWSNVELLASKYKNFMQRVLDISKSEDPQVFLKGTEALLYEAPFRYFESARGANTDEPQRLQRYNILRDALTN